MLSWSGIAAVTPVPAPLASFAGASLKAALQHGYTSTDAFEAEGAAGAAIERTAGRDDADKARISHTFAICRRETPGRLLSFVKHGSRRTLDK